MGYYSSLPGGPPVSLGSLQEAGAGGSDPPRRLRLRGGRHLLVAAGRRAAEPGAGGWNRGRG